MMDGFWFGLALVLLGALALLWVLKHWPRRKSFDAAVDDALDIFEEDLPQRVQGAALPPCLCEVCEFLPDETVEVAFGEILSDALSPSELRRFTRLGVLFPALPPVIRGRDDR